MDFGHDRDNQKGARLIELTINYIISANKRDQYIDFILFFNF